MYRQASPQHCLQLNTVCQRQLTTAVGITADKRHSLYFLVLIKRLGGGEWFFSTESPELQTYTPLPQTWRMVHRVSTRRA